MRRSSCSLLPTRTCLSDLLPSSTSFFFQKCQRLAITIHQLILFSHWFITCPIHHWSFCADLGRICTDTFSYSFLLYLYVLNAGALHYWASFSQSVRCINILPDQELQLYLPQLVQVLKYENYHFGPLACFLITRALLNRLVIGHSFFWALKLELENPQYRTRYGLLLEAYVVGMSCGFCRFKLSSLLSSYD